MKRWDFTQMLEVGHQLFAKIHKKKRFADHNHEIHYLAREINDWLPAGIQSMTEGNYVPRYLKRIYFKDDVVDQLHLSDRILQHILLKQLKPTLSHVVNANCFHIYGPSGVKKATQHIRQILQDEKPNYIIRADIKSFYRSISHYKLIQDINKTYDDPKVQDMLARVITNAIETPRGYKNVGHGVAFRGPLSQFFSAIFLKPLDDAFNAMDVQYFRFQDDILILCKTKRQLSRCRRRMMEVLQERRLKLSRKKSRIGCIKTGFHFLGIDYPGTQPQDNTNAAHSNDDQAIESIADNFLSPQGGGSMIIKHQQNASLRIKPHPRTFRKAREQVRLMVTDGFSTRFIKNYLRRWAAWWVMTAEIWEYKQLLLWFIELCWDVHLTSYATNLLLDIKTAQESALTPLAIAA